MSILDCSPPGSPSAENAHTSNIVQVAASVLPIHDTELRGAAIVIEAAIRPRIEVEVATSVDVRQGSDDVPREAVRAPADLGAVAAASVQVDSELGMLEVRRIANSSWINLAQPVWVAEKFYNWVFDERIRSCDGRCCSRCSRRLGSSNVADRRDSFRLSPCLEDEDWDQCVSLKSFEIWLLQLGGRQIDFERFDVDD